MDRGNTDDGLKNKNNWLYRVLIVLLFSLPCLLLKFIAFKVGPIASVLIYGAGVVSSAFLLSWAAETAQKDISASLATTILALIAILPEYAVDLYFAFTSGQKPEFTKFAVANMTGSNRLLIGIGWPLVVLISVMVSKKKSGTFPVGIGLAPRQRVELFYLTIAGIYALFALTRGGLFLSDSAILLLVFALYVWNVSRESKTEPHLIGVSEKLGALPRAQRRLTVLAFFTYATLLIILVAKPFADSLIGAGQSLGVDQFLLVQWFAPLASEAPELIVAGILAARFYEKSAIGILLSSKINQWTLLIGSLPLAHYFGGGRNGLIFDARQSEEFFLTATQTILGLAFLCDLSFSKLEAFLLFILFSVQFFFVSSQSRMILGVVYIMIAAIILSRRFSSVIAIFKSVLLPGREKS